MKPKIYQLTGVLLLFCYVVLGQANPSWFYYYKDEKKTLTLNTEYLYVVTKPHISTKEQLSLYLGTAVEITKFRQSNVGNSLHTEAGTTTHSSEHWAEVKLNNNLSYAQQISQLRQNPSVELIAPYLKNEAEDKIGLSNYFYVKLRNNNDLNVLLNMAETSNTQVVGQNKFMPLWYTLKCTGNTSYNALEAANLFYESGYFAVAEPDLMVDLLFNSAGNTNTDSNGTAEELFLVPNDPLYTDQWGLNNTGQNGGTAGIDIDAEDAWDMTTGDPGIVVAVLDQGFEMNHPDLQNNVFGLGFNTNSGTIPSQVLGEHGTPCAGIVGAVHNNNEGISGVAPNTSLMSVSNELAFSPTIEQELADGINWAWQNGADIISNSWGSDALETALIDDAINNALTNGRGGLGTVIVFATGNSDTTVSYPASSNPAILAVGAMSPCGERKNLGSCDGENWWGSNYGDELDIVAPGVLIPTADGQGGGGYVGGDYVMNFNGTSSACPHVAGVAALVLSVNPTLSVQQVNDIIEQSATKVREDLYTYSITGGRPNGTWNNETGYGLVNAHAAVLLAQQNCQANLVVIQDVLGGASDNQQAAQTITATNTIFNNGSAIYHAGDQVVLDPGFFTEVGASFHGYIEACTGVFQARVQNVTANDKIGKAQDLPTTIEAVGDPSKMLVFPNPFEWSVSFQFYTQQNAKVLLSVYDLKGKLQLEKKLNYQQEGQQLIAADLSTFPSGTYLYKLFVDKKMFSGKIIKK